MNKMKIRWAAVGLLAGWMTVPLFTDSNTKTGLYDTYSSPNIPPSLPAAYKFFDNQQKISVFCSADFAHYSTAAAQRQTRSFTVIAQQKNQTLAVLQQEIKPAQAWGTRFFQLYSAVMTGDDLNDKIQIHQHETKLATDKPGYEAVQDADFLIDIKQGRAAARPDGNSAASLQKIDEGDGYIDVADIGYTLQGDPELNRLVQIGRNLCAREDFEKAGREINAILKNNAQASRPIEAAGDAFKNRDGYALLALARF